MILVILLGLLPQLILPLACAWPLVALGSLRLQSKHSPRPSYFNLQQVSFLQAFQAFLQALVEARLRG